MKFSTIIPIYNAEQTLERCLKGFLHQTFTDFELILVNDGSTDRSADICRRYASQHPFIRWTDKPNGGVSSARNAGIDMAQGEYLTFADADDEVDPSFLANFAEQCDECDLLMQSIKQTDADGKTRSDHLQESQCKTRDDMAQLIFHLHDRDIPISVCATCFRHDLVREHHLRFDEQIAVCEDVDFVLRCMHQSHIVCTTGKIGYHYYSPTNTKTYQERNGLRTSLRMIEDGFQLTSNEELRNGFLQRYILWCTTELFRCEHTPETREQAARFSQLCLPYLRTHTNQSFPVRLFTLLCFNSLPQTILWAAKTSYTLYKILHSTRKNFMKASECHAK